MVTIAKRGSSPITYGDLAVKIKSISFNANDDSYHKMLGQISVEENAAGRGMLSVLVVHKGGDMRPGPGLLNLPSNLEGIRGIVTSFGVKKFVKFSMRGSVKFPEI